MQMQDMPGHLIRRLHQHSMQCFAKAMQGAGIDLTSVQFAALDAISGHPGIDQAGVAAEIAYDRATIGGVIDRLEGKGLVRRQVSPRDRRAREVFATEAGLELLARMRPLVAGVQDDILARLSPEERTQMLTLLAKSIGRTG